MEILLFLYLVIVFIFHLYYWYKPKTAELVDNSRFLVFMETADEDKPRGSLYAVLSKPQGSDSIEFTPLSLDKETIEMDLEDLLNLFNVYVIAKLEERE